MEIKTEISIQDILNMGKRKNQTIDEHLIKNVYEYAKEKHKNQLRKSGEPYIIHPLHVAYTLAELGLDTQTICAALLHDVVEDTETTYEDIKNNFGEEIALLVEGVTKLSILFKTAEEKQAENYNKMFIAMEKDIRIIILKLADRLHNITTLQHLRRDRQIAIAKETLELYAPIAHKLGMYDLKMKLQDGALKYLYPEEYETIVEKLNKKIKENRNQLEKTKNKMESILKRQRIFAIVNIEIKHIYNIYKKVKEKKIEMDQIKDLFAIKIITREKQTCYKILGIINNQYNIIPRTFKDYIATPRNNRYQAIHEIILGEDGVIIEVQICSRAMYKMAKYGIANYFPYMKQGKIKNEQELEFERNLSGIHDSLELKKLMEDPKEFLKTLKSELLDNEIYVFTPNGDIKVLPQGATAIDFAYLIHEEIGDHIVGCKINSIDMPIMTKLKNGEIVEIIASKEKAIPQKEWVEILKTAKAKSQIIKLLEQREEKKKIKQKIEIEAKDRKNLVLEITKSFVENEINITSLRTEVKDENAKIEIEFEMNKQEKLEKIVSQIIQIDNVKEVNLK